MMNAGIHRFFRFLSLTVLDSNKPEVVRLRGLFPTSVIATDHKEHGGGLPLVCDEYLAPIESPSSLSELITQCGSR
jgi:hypothetical protein